MDPRSFLRLDRHEDADREQSLTRRLRLVLDYWRSLFRREWLPSRSDFDPAAVKPALPILMLCDVLGDPPDFRVRLAGTELDRHFPPLTGRRRNELAAGLPGAAVWQLYAAVLRDGTAAYGAMPYRGNLARFAEMRALAVPFAADGARVDHVLSAIDCIPRRPPYPTLGR